MSNGDTNTNQRTRVGAYGVKKSDFTADTAIQSTDTFDFVRGAQNIKVTFENLVNELGVTGQIIAGDESGTEPVLDKQGSVNLIRNLKAGSGIGISQTPENSLEIATAFTVDTTGAPTFNEATDPVTVRSMVAGDGMSIGFDSGTIQFTVTGAEPVTGKTIQVNTMDDFPDPVAGVITLSDDTNYSINNDLSTADRFVLGQRTKISAVGSSIITLTYTGTGTMFTSTDSSNNIEGITLACSSGTFIDWSDPTTPNTNTFNISDVQVVCDIGGTYDDGLFLFGEDSVFVCTTNGLAISSSTTLNNLFLGTSIIEMAGGAGIGLDLGASVFASVRLDNIQFELTAGSTGLSGLANSGNVDANGLGRLSNTSFFGAGTAAVNISSSDARWLLTDNFPIENSRTDGMVSMNGNATETVITATNTPVKVAGTFVVELDSRMTVDTTGRMTYDPTNPENLPISAVVLMNRTGGGGGGDLLSAYFAINGTVVSETQSQIDADNAENASIPLLWQHKFQTNDFVEVWVENQDDTSNIVVENVVFRVN